jgi:hypothetical protein
VSENKSGLNWTFCQLWIVYTCEFHARFRSKLARFAKKIFFFISKWASLVRNRPRNCTNVNTPLLIKNPIAGNNDLVAAKQTSETLFH